jgi:hypothetical protein
MVVTVGLFASATRREHASRREVVECFSRDEAPPPRRQTRGRRIDWQYGTARATPMHAQVFDRGSRVRDVVGIDGSSHALRADHTLDGL